MQSVQHVRKTDLARNTRQVINDVLRGQTAVVESHGQPEVAIMDILDYRITRAVLRYHAQQPQIDAHTGLEDQKMAQISEPQARFNLVLAHYLAGAISLERAADLLELPWLDLRTRFLRLDVPLRTTSTDQEEAKEDLGVQRMGDGEVDLERLTEEDKLVAELDSLGIRYLSRHTSYKPTSVRPPETLLADLVQQPSARVRSATIAVLLSHPEYAGAVPAALERLTPEEQLNLWSFYLAAVFLQEEHADRLRTLQSAQWLRLPALPQIMGELNVPATGAPRDKLAALGREHRRRAGSAVNWAGTYEQVAHQLLRQWESELRWSQ